MMSDDLLVEVFKALADRNRLHVFDLLLESDRTNSEIMTETGLSQNLLSHHLSVLTDAHLIYAQQSIGDARRRYYCPNLETAWQVAHWWLGHSPTPGFLFPALRERKRVLFLCQHNAARSLIAEALARYLAADALIATSAGMRKAAKLPRTALDVLAAHHVPTDALWTKTFAEVADQSFDYVITVCDRVHEPPLPPELTTANYAHWSLHDPVEEYEDEAEQVAATHELYREIKLRLAFFLQRLAVQEMESGLA